MKKSDILKFLILVLILIFLVYLFNFTEFGTKFKTIGGRIEYKEILTKYIVSFGILSPLIFILIYTILTALLFPGIILTFIGAALFGIWKGTLFSLIGATLGASICFVLSKSLGRRFIENIFENVKPYERLESKGFKTIFILRLIPIVPYNVLNFVSGVTKIRFKDYFLASFFGMVPGTFIYTYLFATLADKVLFGEVSFRDLLQKEILIPIALFIILMIFPVIFKKKVKKILKE